jgi:hypothetical protein
MAMKGRKGTRQHFQHNACCLVPNCVTVFSCSLVNSAAQGQELVTQRLMHRGIYESVTSDSTLTVHLFSN